MPVIVIAPEDRAVFVLVLFMLLILAVAALIVGYVAFPHRGEELPGAPWLGEQMNRLVDAAPTLPSPGDAPSRL